MSFDKFNPNEDGYMAKLVFRFIMLVFSTVCIGAAAYSNIYSIPLLVGILISWLWTLINIIKRLKTAYPIHPGANVAMELLLWQAVGALAGITCVRAISGFALISATTGANAAFAAACKQKTCTTSGTLGPLDKTTTAALVAVGAAALVSMIHFILFVWACVDTHRMRRARREAFTALQMKQSSFSSA